MDSVHENSFILSSDFKRSTPAISPLRNGNLLSKTKGDYSTFSFRNVQRGQGNCSSRLEEFPTPKSILPHLHEKTHFKTATTFTLNYAGNFYCPTSKNTMDKSNSDQDKVGVASSVSKRRMLNSFKNMEAEVGNPIAAYSYSRQIKRRIPRVCVT
jgi:hypothetical protein